VRFFVYTTFDETVNRVASKMKENPSATLMIEI
jgi:hypothetical protein